MFKLDLMVFKWLYGNCKVLGNMIGYGALEGLYMYLILLGGGVAIVLGDNKKK